MKELLVHIISPARAQLFMNFAAYIARDLELSVRFLHVHTPANIPVGTPGSLGVAAAVNQKDIDQELDRIRHHFDLQISKINASDPELPLMEYSIEVGSPPEVMHEYCKGNKINAVMLMGRKNGSMLSDDLGNVDIIRQVTCPVWIIPEGIAYKPFSEILYATDYHKEDLPNIKLLVNFASKFPANITAVHIAGDADFEEKVKGAGFEEMLKKETGYEMIALKVLPEKKGEPLVEELHNFALMMDADLIVLLRENRGFTDRLLYGSRSEKIAKETQLPVLIYNEARK